MKGRFRVSAMLVAAALVLSAAAPACAKKGDILFSKKLYGFLGIGAGTLFLKEAYSARKDAGDLYDQYKAAGTAQQAQELYDESKRKDTRSMVMLGLGLGTLGYSIHLLLSDKEEDLPPPKVDEGLVKVKGVALDVAGDPLGRGVRVRLKKGF